MLPYRQDLKTSDRPPYHHRPTSLREHFKLKHRMVLEQDWEVLLDGAAEEVSGPRMSVFIAIYCEYIASFGIIVIMQ